MKRRVLLLYMSLFTMSWAGVLTGDFSVRSQGMAGAFTALGYGDEAMIHNHGAFNEQAKKTLISLSGMTDSSSEDNSFFDGYFIYGIDTQFKSNLIGNFGVAGISYYSPTFYETNIRLNNGSYIGGIAGNLVYKLSDQLYSLGGKVSIGIGLLQGFGNGNAYGYGIHMNLISYKRHFVNIGYSYDLYTLQEALNSGNYYLTLAVVDKSQYGLAYQYGLDNGVLSCVWDYDVEILDSSSYHHTFAYGAEFMQELFTYRIGYAVYNGAINMNYHKYALGLGYLWKKPALSIGGMAQIDVAINKVNYNGFEEIRYSIGISSIDKKKWQFKLKARQ